jgi:hypothetical protein
MYISDRLRNPPLLANTDHIFLSQQLDVSFFVPVTPVSEFCNGNWVLGISVDSALDREQILCQTSCEEVGVRTPPVR